MLDAKFDFEKAKRNEKEAEKKAKRCQNEAKKKLKRHFPHSNETLAREELQLCPVPPEVAPIQTIEKAHVWGMFGACLRRAHASQTWRERSKEMGSQMRRREQWPARSLRSWTVLFGSDEKNGNGRVFEAKKQKKLRLGRASCSFLKQLPLSCLFAAKDWAQL